MNISPVVDRISILGLALMLGGMGLVVFEVQTGLLRERIGLFAHLGSMACGTALSVWGLKEVVARFHSKLTTRGYQFRIPLEGLAYLVIMFVLFVGSILSRSNVLLLVFCVMVGAFVVNGWMTFTMLRGVRLRRELPRRVMAGETFLVPLTLENRHRQLSIWLMTMHDLFHDQENTLRGEVLFVRVPAGTRRTGAYQLCLLKRGHYEFSQLDVMTRFPLGLVERGVVRESQETLLVYPRLGHLTPSWRRLLMLSTELVSNSREKNGIFQDEMNQIREFRPGDDRRMIHWRTTARMNELMVCEYRECRDRDLLVIVDAWQPAHATAEDAEQFERGLRFAATLCMSYLRMSRQSSLAVRLKGQEVFDWFGDSGKQQADSLLDAFALLEPGESSSPEELTANLNPRYLDGCRILLVTPRPGKCRETILRQHPGLVADLQIFGITADELKHVFLDAVETRLPPSRSRAEPSFG